MEENGMAPVGAYRLAYTQMGSGSPVVLEAAGGAMRRSWHKVMPAIAGFTRLIAFLLGVGLRPRRDATGGLPSLIVGLAHHQLRPVLQRFRQMHGLDFFTPR